MFTYCWCANLLQVQSSRETDIKDKNTLVHWSKYMRDEFTAWLDDNYAAIGGIDENFKPIVVGIDETSFSRRKSLCCHHIESIVLTRQSPLIPKMRVGMRGLLSGTQVPIMELRPRTAFWRSIIHFRRYKENHHIAYERRGGDEEKGSVCSNYQFDKNIY